MTHWQLALHRDGFVQTAMADPAAACSAAASGCTASGRSRKRLVALLAPFGCAIAAHSDGVPDHVFADHGVGRAPSLDALFEGADVLVEVEALRADTRHSVTERRLRLLPDGACFINVGRGAGVDEAALIRVAREGRLQFGLDVLETEPLPIDSPLRGLANVTPLPHIAGPTVERRRESGRMAVDNVHRFAAGTTPLGVSSLERYDRST